LLRTVNPHGPNESNEDSRERSKIEVVPPSK